MRQAVAKKKLTVMFRATGYKLLMVLSDGSAAALLFSSRLSSAEAFGKINLKKRVQRRNAELGIGGVLYTHFLKNVSLPSP